MIHAMIELCISLTYGGLWLDMNGRSALLIYRNPTPIMKIHNSCMDSHISFIHLQSSSTIQSMFGSPLYMFSLLQCVIWVHELQTDKPRVCHKLMHCWMMFSQDLAVLFIQNQFQHELAYLWQLAFVRTRHTLMKILSKNMALFVHIHRDFDTRGC